MADERVGQPRQEIGLDQVLASGAVPTLPVMAMRLLEITENPDVKIQDIAELITTDPGLAAKVLKTVNSSFYGLSKPCPSIERAISMLGLRAVKSLVLGFSMVKLTQGMDEAVDLTAYWKHTIIAAAAARQIAVTVGFGEPDEAFAAALFQDIGVLATVAVFPERYGEVMQEARGDHEKLLRLERQQFGIDHVQIGAALAQKWAMPEQIVVGIRCHHDRSTVADEFEGLVRCVVLGQLAAATVTATAIGQQLATLCMTANAWFGQSEQDVEELIDNIQLSAREIAKLLDQQIDELPTSEQLLGRANEMLLMQQLQTQREAEQAEHAALTDALTGVPNRKRFDRVVEEAVREAQQGAGPVAVLFSDADKFKMVNDTYGHPCGDAVLIELARRISSAVGEHGTVCRYGGEEFAIVMPGADLSAASELAEQIRATVAQTPFDLDGVLGAPPEPLARTVSVGVAAWSPGEEEVTAEQLVQRADKAVYTAKQSGRNNVKCWGVNAGRRAEDTCQDLAAGLGAAMDALPRNGEIHLMLVEDDPLAARLIEAMLLRNPGVSVTTMQDGRAAVEYLRDSQGPGGCVPDLIICDMNIPGYNGLQIIRALKASARFSMIPIFMITAAIESDQWRACREAGATQVFDKRVICKDLKTWCQQVVRSLQQAA